MTAKEFIAKDLESRFGVDLEVHNQYYTGEQWLEQMELYHKAKLKLLGIADVVGRSEQLKAFAEYWNKERADFVEIEDEDIEEFLSL